MTKIEPQIKSITMDTNPIHKDWEVIIRFQLPKLDGVTTDEAAGIVRGWMEQAMRETELHY